MYILKHENEKVNALLKSGNTFTATTLPLEEVHKIMESGKLVESDRSDYPICIDEKWYFEGEESVKEAKKK